MKFRNNPGKSKVSIVIPVYNEEKRVGKALDKIKEFFLSSPDIDLELIIVNDGSKDRTLEIIQEKGQEISCLKLINSPVNEGKGISIRKGVIASSGDYIFFFDVDFSTPLEEIKRCLPLFKEADVIIGSRYVDGASIEKKQPFYRIWGSRVFNFVVQLLLLPGIKDTQCGFKGFQSKAAKEIFSSITLAGYAFDVEVLLLAYNKGFKIKEVGIKWSDDAYTKIKLWRDPPRMFWDILKLWLKHLISLKRM